MVEASDPPASPALGRASTPGPRRRLVASIGVFVALWTLGLAFGVAVEARRYLDELPPVDMAAADKRSTIVVDRNGQLLRPFTTDEGIWRLPVRAAEVDPRYLAMLFAYEDKRFREHGGVDLLAMARAFGQFLSNGEVISGASTLTMQVARLIEPRDKRDLSAKARQVARAIDLEARYSKDEILDLYLALAPFGGNVEGVRAASLAYFGKEPKRLSVAEAALLVALPQSPRTRRPDRFAERARIARDRVLDRMARAGVITAEERDVARREAVPGARVEFPAIAAHAAEQIVKEQQGVPVHRLTIDAPLQASLERLAHDKARLLGPRLSVAIMVVENSTGQIRAAVGGADYFARERAGGVDLTKAFRSPGSALKPFIYAFAFENGIAHPETIIEDRPARFGVYRPENFDEDFHGTVTVRTALQQSLNVPAVELLSLYGPNRFLARFRNAGVQYQLPKGEIPGLAVGLGGLGISPRELARLYVGLARGGNVIPLTIDADKAGEAVEAKRLTDPVAAWYVADALRGAPPPASNLVGSLSFKTGTSYGYRDAWSAGYDRKHTVVVWVGRPDGAPVTGLVGRLVAAPILFDAFKRAGLDETPFDRPKDALVVRKNIDLPPPLRHLRTDVAKAAGAIAVAQLQIAYPPDGARLDLGFVAGSPEPLALKANGGRPPFTWLIDGRPVAPPRARRNASVTPSGQGFSRISVIDGAGETASVVVRIE
jgi:penicillin-binding protein 1C